MATYVVFMSWTDQGIRNVKQGTERFKAAKATAEKLGITVKDMYWTQGVCDCVTILDAPNDEAITAWGLSVGSLGNIRTQTLRAFSVDEMDGIVAKMP